MLQRKIRVLESVVKCKYSVWKSFQAGQRAEQISLFTELLYVVLL